MTPGTVLVPHDALKHLARSLLVAGGLSENHADCVADVLVWADLRGVTSHGVARIPRYLELIEEGDMNVAPAMHYTVDAPVISILEADRAPGPVAMMRATEDTIGKARRIGMSATLIRATTHTAALGYYTRAVAQADMLAIAMAASGPNMAYYGARQAAVSTSPLSIAAPSGNGATTVFDMGTGGISLGKLKQLARDGRKIAEGLALDQAGQPTTDAQTAAIPMPMAGPKGSGLALMIEIIASLLTSNPILADALDGSRAGNTHRQNAIMIAIDIKQLCNLSGFMAELARIKSILKGLPRESGVSEIMLPGERGDTTSARQRDDGIRLPAAILEELRAIARARGLDAETLMPSDA